MGDTARTTPIDLNALGDKLYGYSFFQIMRLLECAYGKRPRFGQSARPIDEAPVRLGQDISLAFAPSTLSSYTHNAVRTSKGLPPMLRQRFFGLFGSHAPLPLHLTEYVLERIYHHRDHTLEGFADLFHHRLISLFYRAWANNEPTVSFDRPDTDRFSDYVGTLAGFGNDSLKQRDALPDLAKLHYTAYFASHNKHSEGLRAMIAHYFGLHIDIEEFVGEWLSIQREDLSRLGSIKTAELGISAILGSQVWSCQHKFRIRFQHLHLNEYLSLLPNGTRLTQLIALVRNYVGDELVWDINLELKQTEVPAMQLNQARLGWTSWLGERQTKQDANDLILNPFWGTL